MEKTSKKIYKLFCNENIILCYEKKTQRQYISNKKSNKTLKLIYVFKS